MDLTGLVERLMPLLRDAKSAGRVDYRGVCDVANGFGRLDFPDLGLRASSHGETGLDAIRDLLPAEAVLVERPGIISIRLANVPDEILSTRIRHLEFSRQEQFTAALAILVIGGNSDVQAASEKFGYSLPTEDISILPATPQEGLPHLPPSFSGVTLDEALNEVAKTFGGIVFFGACEDQHLYLIQFETHLGT